MYKTLMVLAAGLGQRYGGIKQIAPVGPNGEALIDYAVYDAVTAGFDKIVFIIKHSIEEDFRVRIGDPASKKAAVLYAFQDDAYLPDFYHIPQNRTKMLGTVHAMLAAKGAIREPFAIINADDYYGRDAFETLAGYLDKLTAQKACMVGYALKNTVSKNGAVTRGVCHVKDGKLSKVTETYKISLFPDGTIRSTDNGPQGEVLDGESTVSMNFWGFSPAIFPVATAYFDAFLKSLPADDITSEYPLPTMVDQLLKAKKLEVDMLLSKSTWMGMTYPQDQALVSEGLLALQSTGVYPKTIK